MSYGPGIFLLLSGATLEDNDMPELSSAGQNIAENGTHTIRDAAGGFWLLDNPHGATVVITEGFATDGAGVPEVSTTAFADKALVPMARGKKYTLTVSGLAAGANVSFSRFAAIREGMLETPPDYDLDS